MLNRARIALSAKQLFAEVIPPSGISNEIKLSIRQLDLLCIIVGIIIVIAFRVLWLLNHYYVDGALVLDTSWFAHLISSGDFFLRNPSAINTQSYYNTHLSPAIGVYSILSPLRRFPLALQAGIFLGLINSLAIIAIYLPIRFNILSAFKPSHSRIIALLFSISFSLFGEPDRLLRYPHFEVAIPLLISLSIFFYAWLKLLPAILFLLLAIAFREDAGFHASLCYFLIILFLLIRRRQYSPELLSSLLRPCFVIVVLCFSLSLFAVVFQKIFYSSDNALQRIYLGDPIFQHVSSSFLLMRWFEISKLQWLMFPVFCLLVLAILSRNLLYILGYLSNIPWFLLGLVAASQTAGSFQLYYGFPFLLGLLFPLSTINTPLDCSPRILRGKSLSAAFLIAAIYFPYQLYSTSDYIQRSYGIPSFSEIQKVNKVSAAIAARSTSLRKAGIMVTSELAALHPDSFFPEDIVRMVFDSSGKMQSRQRRVVNGIIYLEGGWEQPLVDLIVASGIIDSPVKCSYKKTNISIILGSDLRRNPLNAQIPGKLKECSER